MKTMTLKRIVVAMMISGIFTQSAYAVSLGDMKIRSYNNEPLSAQVKVEGLTIGTNNVTPSAQVINGNKPVPVKVSTESNDDGSYVLLTSNTPITEPIVEIEVELQGGIFRTTRVYTVLTDPRPVPAEVEKPVQPYTVPTTTTPVAPVGTITKEQNMDGSWTYKIKVGDSLLKIARIQYKPYGIKPYIAMEGIIRANPDKIKKNNMIRAGDTLIMPSPEVIKTGWDR